MKYWSTGSALLVTLTLCSFNSFAEQQKSWSVELAADAIWASTKINDVRDEDDTLPSFYADIEHDIAYVPNFRLRYTGIDTAKLKHDKTDFTFYWRPLRTENLLFDAGFTLSNYANSYFEYSDSSKGDFDDTVFSWFAAMGVRVPSTNLHFISEFDFADTSSMKSTDLTVGAHYDIPLDRVSLGLRGGYRVLDYVLKDFGEKPYGFAHGWYAGASIKF
ncbi:TIGR04219 family outer membrane beta-barrel protein [Vibrio ulleungensis]|jgi:outer membrane protein|uniref:TIGR04219 family outer membrane beta-barrel protein n=1 Tax=Vibrio ulleungensis TaxID=2807619 RepID=A0ABS2HL27_9VIBR|nr:TIGR04219 family outer membrane beta-barrel protein [Vibrio ulleungensis]MBM7038193.1 TIGR04219 family outer membrane beta-barrel protein [Vibrio ulleungensis]